MTKISVRGIMRFGRDRAAAPGPGAADARSRPAPLRRRGDRRAGALRPAPRLHERAFVLGPSPSSTPGLEVPGRARFRPSWRGYTEPRCPTSTTWTSTRPSSSSRSKREYQAVFGLFRYCVLTPDATYLCNKLERTCRAAAGVPVLPARARGRLGLGQEPADAHHPARQDLITSGDVTIEELRGEGDEPPLTAEALAERIGEPFRRATKSSSSVAADDAARGRRRQHADGLRSLRRAPSSASAGGSPPRRSGRATSSARCSRTSSTSTRSTGSASRRRCRGSSGSTSTSPSAGRRRSCS